MIIAIHIIAVGVWLGCVLTEALFERALLGTSRENETILAKLHQRVDLFVEIPAFVIVVCTGVILVLDQPASVWLTIKIAFGIIAVVANIYCVHLVFQRVKHSNEGNWKAFEHTDHLQHKVGAIVLLGILGATIVGILAIA